jgi:hypothetical protein
MKKRSESQWKKLVAEQVASGMTVSLFARKKGLSAAHFSTKRQLLLRAGFMPGISAFVPVQRASPVISHDIRIRYGGCEMVLAATTDPAWLAGLLKALA